MADTCLPAATLVLSAGKMMILCFVSLPCHVSTGGDVKWDFPIFSVGGDATGISDTCVVLALPGEGNLLHLLDFKVR